MPTSKTSTSIKKLCICSMPCYSGACYHRRPHKHIGDCDYACFQGSKCKEIESPRIFDIDVKNEGVYF